MNSEKVSKIKKGLLALLLFATLSICMNLFCVYSREGFFLRDLHPPVQVSHKTPMETIPPGPYTYLGHGKQSMAFLSSDETKVLKLFYWKRSLRKTWVKNPENWLRFSSPTWIAKLAKKRGEMICLFTRYLWGFDLFPKETGIVGVHFFQTEAPIPVELVDRTGQSHLVDLSRFPFVVQQKVTLLGHYLDAKLDVNDLAGAKGAIALLRDYFNKRIEMGYLDNPEVFVKNYGFFQDAPVQIDVGKLKKFDSFDVSKEKKKVFTNLDKFLQKHYPQLLEHD